MVAARIRKSGIDLNDFLDILENSHRYANYIVSNCPFHDDSRPSFFVYDTWYQCMSCDAKGHPAKLLEKLSGRVVVKTTPTHYSKNPWTRWTEDRRLKDVLISAWRTLRQRNGSIYLRNRGITTENQIRYRLGMIEDWITFPIFDLQNKLVSAVARANEGNSSQSKYVVPALHNSMYTLYIPFPKDNKNSNIVLLTFGIIDALSLSICGYFACSTTGGMKINPRALDIFRKRIIIIPDQHEESAARKLASKLGWRGSVLKLKYPDTAKDPSDFFSLNKDGMTKQIEQHIEEVTSDRHMG